MSNANQSLNDTQNLSAEALVSKGLVAHQQGDLDSAACLYQAAIEQDNQQSDALHLLGMVAFQLEQVDKAEQLIHLAIKFKPEVPVYYNNLGNIYLSHGATQAAIESYQKAVKLNEDYFEAKFNLANAYVEYKDLGLAEIFYIRTLQVAPDFVPALQSLGELYIQQEKWQEAQACYQKLSQLQTENTDYQQRLKELQNVNERVHDTDEREQQLRDVLIETPEDLEANVTLANLLATSGRNHEAENIYDYVLRLDPKNTDSLFGKATLLKARKKLEEAAVNYQKAVEINPSLVDAQYNLANTYKELGWFDEAVETYGKVLSINERHLGATVNLAVTFTLQGGFSDALILLKAAEAKAPENYILQNNLGMVHHLLRQFDLAEQYYRSALSQEDSPEIRWNLALTLLAQGKFTQGFELYESRKDLPELSTIANRKFSFPQWHGEALQGKSILVYFEQGFGDAIQFCRLLPQLLEQGAIVTFEVPELLVTLIQTLDNRIKVISEVRESYDYFCPLMSLPHYLSLTLDNIPVNMPYLHVPRNENAIFNLDDNHLNIGVAWTGNPRTHNVQSMMIDKRRSCDIKYFESLADLENIQLYSLQKDQEPGLFSGIINVMGEVRNFKDTAEIIQSLDLVITVDTAVAHLAGALGKPVWLLSRFDGCWRWLENREDSPWYPSMKIYRQPEPGDWQSVFRQVEQDLILLKGTGA